MPAVKLNPTPFAALLILASTATAPLFGQENPQDDMNLKTRTLVGMPLITNNPAMETAFGAVGMFLFKPNAQDSISPPSTLMATGLYSTNDSYVFVAGGKFFLKEDHLRLTGFGGTSRINNDFEYEIESQDVHLVYSEVRSFFGVVADHSIPSISKDLFVGLQYMGFWTSYSFTRGTDEQNQFTEELFSRLGIEDNYLSSIGVPVSFDTRDYPFYPTSGWDVTVRPKFFATWLGGDNNYTDIDYDARYYYSFDPTKVMAFQLAGGSAFGDVPFGGYQMYGARNTLRGYAMGKYRGEHMVAGQAEFRWTFHGRFGAVGFAGLGTVWGGELPEGREVFEKGLLPSVGAGLRFTLSTEKRINARIDYAVGVNGNDGLYIGIMEAF